MEGKLSSSLPATSDVPQGSIIKALLFVLYIRYLRILYIINKIKC